MRTAAGSHVMIWSIVTAAVIGCERPEPEAAEPEPSPAPETAAELQSQLQAAAARRDWNGLAALLMSIPDDDRSDADRLQLATVLVQAQRLDEAARIAMPLTRPPIESVEAAWIAAYASFHLGDYDAAAEVIDRYGSRLHDAGHIDALLLRGMIDFHRDDLDAARRRLEQLVAADPRHVPGHHALARVLAEAGDEAGAQRHLDQATTLQRTIDEAVATQARLSAQASALNRAFEAGDHERCEQLIAAMLVDADTAMQAQLYRYLARVHRAQGAASAAADADRRAAELEAGTP